jgi:hypothetical protein
LQEEPVYIGKTLMKICPWKVCLPSANK